MKRAAAAMVILSACGGGQDSAADRPGSDSGDQVTEAGEGAADSVDGAPDQDATENADAQGPGGQGDGTADVTTAPDSSITEAEVADVTPDQATDVEADAGVEGSMDAAADIVAEVDAGADAGVDAPTDAFVYPDGYADAWAYAHYCQLGDPLETSYGARLCGVQNGNTVVPPVLWDCVVYPPSDDAGCVASCSGACDDSGYTHVYCCNGDAGAGYADANAYTHYCQLGNSLATSGGNQLCGIKTGVHYLVPPVLWDCAYDQPSDDAGCVPTCENGCDGNDAGLTHVYCCD